MGNAQSGNGATVVDCHGHLRSVILFLYDNRGTPIPIVEVYGDRQDNRWFVDHLGRQYFHRSNSWVSVKW